jgi:hypothetical protein
MSRFYESIADLVKKKVRFYVGGGEKGFVQGPVTKVDGNVIYIEKEGEIRGPMHTITLNIDAIRFYEIDKLVATD